MSVELQPDPRLTTIGSLRAAYNLTLVVGDRDPGLAHFGRHLAYFQELFIQEGDKLTGEHGNGDTPVLAVADYARKISGKFAVIIRNGPGHKGTMTVLLPPLTGELWS